MVYTFLFTSIISSLVVWSLPSFGKSKLNACAITINSSDERDKVLKNDKYFPKKDWNVVELTDFSKSKGLSFSRNEFLVCQSTPHKASCSKYLERCYSSATWQDPETCKNNISGKVDPNSKSKEWRQGGWLGQKCEELTRQGVQCHTLVISGHYSHKWYSDPPDKKMQLKPLDMLRLSCEKRCQNLFSTSVANFLFGCNAFIDEEKCSSKRRNGRLAKYKEKGFSDAMAKEIVNFHCAPNSEAMCTPSAKSSRQSQLSQRSGFGQTEAQKIVDMQCAENINKCSDKEITKKVARYMDLGYLRNLAEEVVASQCTGLNITSKEMFSSMFQGEVHGFFDRSPLGSVQAKYFQKWIDKTKASIKKNSKVYKDCNSSFTDPFAKHVDCASSAKVMSKFLRRTERVIPPLQGAAAKCIGEKIETENPLCQLVSKPEDPQSIESQLRSVQRRLDGIEGVLTDPENGLRRAPLVSDALDDIEKTFDKIFSGENTGNICNAHQNRSAFSNEPQGRKRRIATVNLIESSLARTQVPKNFADSLFGTSDNTTALRANKAMLNQVCNSFDRIANSNQNRLVKSQIQNAMISKSFHRLPSVRIKLLKLAHSLGWDRDEKIKSAMNKGAQIALSRMFDSGDHQYFDEDLVQFVTKFTSPETKLNIKSVGDPIFNQAHLRWNIHHRTRQTLEEIVSSNPHSTNINFQVAGHKKPVNLYTELANAGISTILSDQDNELDPDAGDYLGRLKENVLIPFNERNAARANKAGLQPPLFGPVDSETEELARKKGIPPSVVPLSKDSLARLKKYSNPNSREFKNLTTDRKRELLEIIAITGDQNCLLDRIGRQRGLDVEALQYRARDAWFPYRPQRSCS